MTRRIRNLGEAGFGLGIALFGVIVAVLTAAIPVGPAYARIGPRLFPWLIAGALIVVGVVLVADALIRRNGEPRPQIDWKALGLVGLGLAMQIALMTGAGYILASTALFVVVAAAFGERRLLLTAAIGLVLTTVTQIVFTWGLGLRLPGGVLAGFL